MVVYIGATFSASASLGNDTVLQSALGCEDLTTLRLVMAVKGDLWFWKPWNRARTQDKLVHCVT